MALYHALCASTRVVVCLDGPRHEAEQWLRNHGLTAHADVIDTSMAFAGTDLRERQLAVERARGGVDMLVEADPERAASALQKGITTMLFLPPNYIRPEFRPDLTRKIKPWATIAAELDAQKEIVRDNRLAAE